MIRLKDNSVNIKGMCVELLFGIRVAEEVYWVRGAELIITSCNDGRHSPTSLHYDGCAVDLRIHNLSNEVEPSYVAEEIKSRLGQDFDVILEAVATDNEHIHMEWQPRRR